MDGDNLKTFSAQGTRQPRLSTENFHNKKIGKRQLQIRRCVRRVNRFSVIALRQAVLPMAFDALVGATVALVYIAIF